MIRYALAIPLLMMAWDAGSADDAKPPRSFVTSADVVQWMAALIFVLLLIAILAWLMRKSGKFTLSDRNPLSVRAVLSLGVRERLVLVNVGERQLLLAVTPGRVEKLLELEGEQRIEQEGAMHFDSHPFARRLQQMMSKPLHD